MYVGVTCFNLGKRWNEHLQDAQKTRCMNRPLYHAMNLYGREHFRISLIEECSASVMYEREKYWIEKFDSFINGYNATFGGTGKPNVDYQQVIDTYNMTRNQKEAAEILGIDVSTINKVLRMNKINYVSSKEILGKRVGMFSLDGMFLKSFFSEGEAARYINDSKDMKVIKGIASHIGSVCNGKRKTAYKYLWRYV